MWPWEHLAFAYVLVSVYGRLRWRTPPTARVAVTAAVASQLPDLVDKPLAWGFGVLPAGRSLAHSLFVAVPLVALALAVGASRDSRSSQDRSRASYVAAAFAIAYLSHLLGDIIYPLAVTGHLHAGFLLWPVVPADEHSSAVAILPYVTHLATSFTHFLATPRGRLYLLAEFGLLGAGLVAWILDGAPGIGPLRDAVTRVTRPHRS